MQEDALIVAVTYFYEWNLLIKTTLLCINTKCKTPLPSGFPTVWEIVHKVFIGKLAKDKKM
jgi:hypothetical protein